VITAELLELLSRQYGVVHLDQLRDELGVTRASVSRARRRGLLDDVMPGVVRLTSTPLTFEGRASAAQLRAGDDCVLSGWTSGRILGLRSMPTGTIHLTTPQGFRRSMPDWVDVHRTAWHDADRLIRDGFALASPMRTLFGLAAAFNQHRFERAAEDAWHLGLITPDVAASYLRAHRCRGKDGVTAIERWLERSAHQSLPAQSNLERDLIRQLESIGVARPVRQHALVLPSGSTIHLDIAWPDIRLAVEPGASWFHGGDLGQRRDQDRDRACAEVGWLVIRFDETMREDLTGAARQVARVHARRTADLRNMPSSSR
jgi:very-short-patch-repair endonuclease